MTFENSRNLARQSPKSQGKAKKTWAETIFQGENGWEKLKLKESMLYQIDHI